MVFELVSGNILIYTVDTENFIGDFRPSGLSVIAGALLSVLYSCLVFSLRKKYSIMCLVFNFKPNSW